MAPFVHLDMNTTTDLIVHLIVNTDFFLMCTYIWIIKIVAFLVRLVVNTLISALSILLEVNIECNALMVHLDIFTEITALIVHQDGNTETPSLIVHRDVNIELTI